MYEPLILSFAFVQLISAFVTCVYVDLYKLMYVFIYYVCMYDCMCCFPI